MLSTLFLATLPSFIIFRSAGQTLFREIDIRDRCYKASVWSSIQGRFRSSHKTRKSQPDPKNMLSTLFPATLPSFIIFRSAGQTLFREIDIRDRCYKALVWSSIQGRFRSSHKTRKSQPDPKKHVKYIISSNQYTVKQGRQSRGTGGLDPPKRIWSKTIFLEITIIFLKEKKP